MAVRGLLAYRKTQVQTAHPVQLVVQLYEDGAIRFTEKAIEALLRGDFEAAHNAFVRAEEVIAELRASLKMDAGPVADSLNATYDVMFRKLVLANTRKDVKPAQEVLGFLRELLPVWQSIARQAVSGAPIVDAPLPLPTSGTSAGSVR